MYPTRRGSASHRPPSRGRYTASVVHPAFLDRLWDLIERIQAWLTLGGIVLAALASLLFVGAWVLSVVRQPKATGTWGSDGLSWAALGGAYGATALTAAAAVSRFVPVLGVLWTLRLFAVAVLVAALVWILAMVVFFRGAPVQGLRRARKAVFLAGTPWYCLVLYLTALL